MQKITWEIPLKTVSEGNSTEHWRVKSKRHRMQQFFIRQLFDQETENIDLPCVVTMTRISPRELDEEDNLRMAFKWIKDEISECIIPNAHKTYTNKSGRTISIKGRVDSDKRIKWLYGQEKGQIQGVRIEIASDIAS